MTISDKTSAGPKERRFLDALRDLFVGVKVDGQSGYINLMRIKAAYFQGAVEPELMKAVGKAVNDFPEFREELFDKLHAFFSRYFSRSGSICFAYTPQHMSVYEKIYSDEQDVLLFWKTHMLYYVKTDRLFKDLKMDVDNHTFFFDCSELEHKKSNEKREMVFALDKVEKDGVIRLAVAYSERGRQTKTEEILKALKKAEHPITEAVLDKAIRVFGRQSEVDYFINKDARGFLREQFDLWMYQYVFKDETSWGEARIRQLQSLKEIAFKIIDFIGQFEDELVRIWNKPKFVRGSFYVITLDRIAARPDGLDLIADLIKHGGMKAQVAEWRDLGIVRKDFDPKEIVEGRGTERKLVNGWKSLPLDTRHFKNLETRLLALFDNLDDAIDGRLIKSENYQALNSVRERYKGRIKFFYIDPPYNTGEDEFAYVDQYQRASWLSMMTDRLNLGRDAIRIDGAFLSSIGREEFANLKQITNRIFGEENCLAELIWEKGRKNDAKYFSVGHDYLLVYAKSKEELDRRKTVWREEKQGAREILAEYRRLKNLHGDDVETIQTGIQSFYQSLPKGHPSLKFRRANKVDKNGLWRDHSVACPRVNGPRFNVPNPKTKKMCKVPDTGWRFATLAKFQLYADHGFIEFRDHDKEPPILKRYLNYVATDFDPDSKQNRTVYDEETDEEISVKVLSSVFQAFQQPAVLKLRALMGKDVFKNPKDPEVIARLIRYITDPGDLVADVFLGSGSTGEAVISLIRSGGGRKFLFVESANYVETIILPRFKKLAWSDKWEDGKATKPNGASLFFKCFCFEQYEDAIRNAVYKDDGDLFLNTKTNPFSQYLFFRDEKMARALELDYKKDDVNIRLDRLYPDIDLAETLSCITGKWIKRITADEVEFADGSKQSLQKPDWRLLKPLIFWGPIV